MEDSRKRVKGRELGKIGRRLERKGGGGESGEAKGEWDREIKNMGKSEQ